MAPRLIKTLLIAPALLLIALLQVGCAEPAPAGYERVVLDGRTFTLEIVADDASRIRGLGGRESIPADGGMLFVFTSSERREFVMRDCLVDIDIIFLDGSATIVAMHHMPTEDPKRDDETMLEYNDRLKRYSSRFDSQFVIELQGGMLEQLSLSDGQRVDLDVKRLRSMAK